MCPNSNTHKYYVIVYIFYNIDPPRIISAGPDRVTTAPLYSPAAFECVAEGNPQPTFKWIQRYKYIITLKNVPYLKMHNLILIFRHYIKMNKNFSYYIIFKE